MAQSIRRILGMRSSLIVASLAVACGDQKFTVVNAEPDVMITSHGDGSAVGEGQSTLFIGVVDDADDQEDELVATWIAGERVVCETEIVKDLYFCWALAWEAIPEHGISLVAMIPVTLLPQIEMT